RRFVEHARDRSRVVTPETRGEGGHRRAFVNEHDEDEFAEDVLQLVDEPRGVERSAAEVEERIVNPDFVQLEDVFPRANEPSLERSAWGHGVALQIRAAATGRG